MKNILLFFIFSYCSLFFAERSNAQSYRRLADASGFNTDSYQDTLQAVAAKLCAIFDTTGFAGQFKVYDFGFYLHQKNTTGGYPEPFAQKLIEVQDSSPYYLLFGKQTDRNGIYTKFWVDLVLPTDPPFSCIDSMSSELRDDITDKLKFVANTEPFSNDNFASAEIRAIDTLTKFLANVLECCGAQQRSGGDFCTTCIFSPIDALIKINSLNIASSDPILIVNDPDYYDHPQRGEQYTQQRLTSFNISIKTSSLDDEIELDDLIDGYISQFKEEHKQAFGSEPSFSKFVFKYPRDCSNLTSTLDDYNASSSNFKIFVGIVNFDNKYGVLTVSIAANYLGNADGDPIREDELELFNESLNGQPCDVLLGGMARKAGAVKWQTTEFYDSRTLEEKKKLDEIYKIDEIEGYFNESNYQFGIVWWKEYEINLKYHLIHDDIGIDNLYIDTKRAWWDTNAKLCAGTFHTILDACGLVPVLGEACDGVSSVLYLTSGDLKNAALSAGAMVPIAGYGVIGTKYGGKLWNALGPTSDCLSGNRQESNYLGNSYCRVLNFVVLENKAIRWIGGRQKLHDIMTKAKDFVEWTVNGITRKFNPDLDEAHHVIPWEFLNPEKGPQRNIIQMATQKGWHASNPLQNGFPVPKTLHISGGHINYNSYVEKELDALDQLNLSPNQALLELKDLVSDLQSKINSAILQNTKIDTYFKQFN